jgi:hypothetical protein
MYFLFNNHSKLTRKVIQNVGTFLLQTVGAGVDSDDYKRQCLVRMQPPGKY